MRAISFLGAGTQPWSSSVCTVHKDRFAYASTLAVNVYQVLILGFLKTIGKCRFFLKQFSAFAFKYQKSHLIMWLFHPPKVWSCLSS
jgi:hypothetical protein